MQGYAVFGMLFTELHVDRIFLRFFCAAFHRMQSSIL